MGPRAQKWRAAMREADKAMREQAAGYEWTLALLEGRRPITKEPKWTIYALEGRAIAERDYERTKK